MSQISNQYHLMSQISNRYHLMSLDFPQIFSFLFQLLLLFVFLLLLLFCCCCFYFKNIFWYTFDYACGGMSFSLGRFRKQDYFFWPKQRNKQFVTLFLQKRKSVEWEIIFWKRIFSCLTLSHFSLSLTFSIFLGVLLIFFISISSMMKGYFL